MTLNKIIVLIGILGVFIEVRWKPRIGTTTDGKIILWYGTSKREFWIIFE